VKVRLSTSQLADMKRGDFSPICSFMTGLFVLDFSDAYTCTIHRHVSVEPG